jgi:hypothetical protein
MFFFEYVTHIGSVPTDLNIYVNEPEKCVRVGRGEYELIVMIMV